MTKVTVNLRDSQQPTYIQLIEQGPAGRQHLAYSIVTFFAGSFLMEALYTDANWNGNESLHMAVIDNFDKDYGFDDPQYHEWLNGECLESVEVIE